MASTASSRSVSTPRDGCSVHSRSAAQFPSGFGEALNPQQRVLQLWWTGGFTAVERVFNQPAELDDYVEPFVAAQLGLRPAAAAPNPRSTVSKTRSPRSRASFAS